MSALVISKMNNFIGISKKLEEMGVSNIHFYNSMNERTDIPMLSIMPFMDMVVLDDSSDSCSYMDKVREEAEARHIYVVNKECLDRFGEADNCMH